MPKGVKSIGSAAFVNCQNLQSISLPEGITLVEASTFRYCYNLRYVSLPEGLTDIHSGAFAQCAIEEVTIPSSVNYIWGGSFYQSADVRGEGNVKLKRVIFLDTSNWVIYDLNEYTTTPIAAEIIGDPEKIATDYFLKDDGQQIYEKIS